jgi:hypothetical protein
MSLIDPWPPVRQAIVRALRANFVLAAQLTGDWTQGAAPQDTQYPLGTYSLVPSPALYDWSGVLYDMLVDVVVFSKDQGDAASLAQLVFTTLQDARLAVTGLTSLTCRSTGVISLQDVDEKGDTVYEEGRTWRVRVAQSYPALQSLTFTGDSTIS